MAESSRDAQVRDSYERTHENLLKSMNAYGIVLSLLATLSYSAFLRTPERLGHSQSATSTWQKVFFSFNGVSFFFSLAGLLLFASTSFTPTMVLRFEYQNTSSEVDAKAKLLAEVLPIYFYITLFFVISLTCCAFAYTFAGLTTVPNNMSERLPIIVTCAFGGYIFCHALFISVLQFYDLWRGIKKDTRLWTALKDNTTFGKIFSGYVDSLE